MQVAEIMLTWVTVSVPPRMLPPDEPLIEPEPLALDPVDPEPPEPEALEPVEPEPVEPEPVEPEPVAPEPVEPEPVEPALLEPEPDDEPEPLGDDELLIEPLAPPKRPVIITWCPTCCARFTELSADRRRSEPLRPLMLPPRPAVDEEPSLPDVDPEAVAPEPEPAEPEPVEPAPVEPEPVEPEPVEPDPDADDPDPDDPVEPEPEVEAPEPELEPMLDPEPLPIFAFFRTKLPPLAPAPLADELLVSLLLELVLEPSAFCRQPVAVTEPAVSDDERPVDDD